MFIRTFVNNINKNQLYSLSSASSSTFSNRNNAILNNYRYNQTSLLQSPISALNIKSFYSSFDFNQNKTISKSELEHLINESRSKDVKSYVLIDVRNPAEVEETGLIESAISIPLGVLPAALEMNDEDFYDAFQMKKFQKTDNIIFYCLKGVRSSMAAEMCKSAGYNKSINYPGSASEWFNI